MTESHDLSESPKVGGIDALYCEYFDLQFQVLEVLQPEVVGHLRFVSKTFGSSAP